MTVFQAAVLTIVGALLAALGWLLTPPPANTVLLIVGVIIAVVGGLALLLALVRPGGPRV